MTPSPARTRVKICGVRDAKTARTAVEAGADAVGVVWAEGSPRRVTAEQAELIRRALPPWVSLVHVVVGEAVTSPVGRPGDWVQVHGALEAIPSVLEGRRLIRALAWPVDLESIERWSAMPGVEAVLVDAPAPGSGATFDHDALAAWRSHIRTPLIVAGGLTPENVREVIVALTPFAVDVSSGVEQSRGVKDPGRIRAFCDAVAAADHARRVAAGRGIDHDQARERDAAH